jgi:hypothetical protein
MFEAQNSKLNLSKGRLPNVDEIKLKKLEERLIGPSSNGLMPSEIEPILENDFEVIKSSKKCI